MTAPASVRAGRGVTVHVEATFSERISVWLVGPRGALRLARTTTEDELVARSGRLRPGVHLLRARGFFTYPVPGTGELGLCQRTVRRSLLAVVPFIPRD